MIFYCPKGVKMIFFRNLSFNRLVNHSFPPSYILVTIRSDSAFASIRTSKVNVFAKDKIREISQMSINQNPLAFEQFKEKHLPSFEEASEKLKKFRPDMSFGEQEKIYTDTCRGQYRNYIQALTTHNDPSLIL